MNNSNDNDKLFQNDIKEKREIYETNLERVRQWHSFTEARNAAVITLVVALLGVYWSAALSIFTSLYQLFTEGDRNISCSEKWLLIYGVAVSLAVTVHLFWILIISISSYKPRYNKNLDEKDDGSTKSEVRSAEDNFLYWKTAAKNSCDDYRKSLDCTYYCNEGCKKCNSKGREGKMEDTYSKEIVANARITRYMYKRFEKATQYLKKGLMVFAGLMSIFLIWLLVIMVIMM